MKHIFNISLFLLITINNSFAAIPKGEKSQMAFNRYLQSNYDLRMQYENKLFEKHSAFLRKNHDKRVAQLKEVFDLQQQMVWGNNQKNAPIEAKIRQKKEVYNTEMKHMRAEFFGDSLKKEMAEFTSRIKVKKEQLKAEL
jgi:hypothetical protein